MQQVSVLIYLILNEDLNNTLYRHARYRWLACVVLHNFSYQTNKVSYLFSHIEKLSRAIYRCVINHKWFANNISKEAAGIVLFIYWNRPETIILPRLLSISRLHRFAALISQLLGAPAFIKLQRESAAVNRANNQRDWNHVLHVILRLLLYVYAFVHRKRVARQCWSTLWTLKWRGTRNTSSEGHLDNAFVWVRFRLGFTAFFVFFRTNG